MHTLSPQILPLRELVAISTVAKTRHPMDANPQLLELFDDLRRHLWCELNVDVRCIKRGMLQDRMDQMPCRVCKYGTLIDDKGYCNSIGIWAS